MYSKTSGNIHRFYKTIMLYQQINKNCLTLDKENNAIKTLLTNSVNNIVYEGYQNLKNCGLSV